MSTIETLREITNLLSSLGGEAKEAFVYYLAFELLRPVVWTLCTVLGVIVIIRVLHTFVVAPVNAAYDASLKKEAGK